MKIYKVVNNYKVMKICELRKKYEVTEIRKVVKN